MKRVIKDFSYFLRDSMFPESEMNFYEFLEWHRQWKKNEIKYVLCRRKLTTRMKIETKILKHSSYRRRNVVNSIVTMK